MTMLLDTHIPPPATVSCANQEGVSKESIRARASAHFIGSSHYQSYRLNLKIVAWDCGRKWVRLGNQPVVRVDAAQWKLSVPEWGVEVPIADAATLPRAMARRFLELKEKAADDNLSERDAEHWLHIVHTADMNEFALRQGKPRYAEGKLLSTGDAFRVIWQDGVETTISQKLQPAFELVNLGEEFSAYVKFGPDDALLHAEDVIPRTPLKPV